VAPVQKSDNTAMGIHRADHVTLCIRRKVGSNFADKRRSLGFIVCWRTKGHGVLVGCALYTLLCACKENCFQQAMYTVSFAANEIR
jgi:hypothetical protein